MAVSELRKALTAAGTGSNLIPQDLEPIIRQNLLAKSPFLNLIPRIKASGNVHTVVKRTANISAWVEGESTDASYNNSTYARRNVTVKIARTHGKVTDFQQSAAMSFADSLTNEIMSATDGMRQLMEYLPLWGTADDTGFTGDAYQYSGLYPWILNDGPTTNVFDLAAKVALSNLDDAMDITSKKYQYLTGGQWVWFMSPQMISTVSALQTLVRRQVPQLMFEGGFVMDTYNGVPILPSGYVQPASVDASVTSLSASAGGTGSNSNLYRYKVAAITLFGEQVSSATASAQLASNTTATLTWTANTSAKSYAIYRTAAGEADTAALYDLLDIVAAKSYDGTGAVSTNVTTYADVIGAKTTIAAVHPLGLYDSSGKAEEVIFLAYLEPTYGLSLAVLPPTLGDPLSGDPTNNLVRFVPISVTDDTYAFRLKSYHVLQVADAAIAGAVIRRARRNAS